MGWLDHGMGHSFKNDPWGWATRFLCKERGWATNIFYTEIQVNKEIKYKNYGIRLFVQIPSELKEKLASHLLTSHLRLSNCPLLHQPKHRRSLILHLKTHLTSSCCEALFSGCY